MEMSNQKTGILVRFPLVQKKGKKPGYQVSFGDFMLRKISEGLNIGYKCFVFEITDDDFDSLEFNVTESAGESLNNYINNLGVRVALYIKGKKYLTSDSEAEILSAHSQIVSCLDFIKKLDIKDFQEVPIILHIGGAKGDRRGTMENFCKKIECWFHEDDIKRLAVVNDEKPSLFSVKDLLPGVFYRIKIPIVFRSTSYPTNQGNLTLNESLFLAASTWKRTVNPIFLYLPSNTNIGSEETRPFGLELDFVFDNRLPEP
jgi:UV DNA damage repair endonuclease